MKAAVSTRALQDMVRAPAPVDWWAACALFGHPAEYANDKLLLPVRCARCGWRIS